LRLSITDLFKGGIGGKGGSGYVSVSGKIEAGSMQIGESVLLMPANEVGIIKGKYD